jgi:cytochrome c biogenesis protein CcdA
MIATVNPCGFAMLPAYLGFFVGSDRRARSSVSAVRRALGVTAAVTAGFVVVFGSIGLVVSTVAESVDDHLPKVTVVIGLALVGLGVWLASGRELAVALPKLERGGRDRTIVSMFVFGLSYAIASLSCTLGPFLVVLTPTFRDAGVASGALAFVAYALGMGLVLGAVTVALALSRNGLVRRIRGLVPIANRLAGALLIVAGLYTAYYGWWELRGSDADPVIDAAQRVRDQLARWVSGWSPWLLAAAIGALAAAAWAASRRARRTRDDVALDAEAGER